MRKININEINRAANYEGYLWMSDATEPVVLNGEPIDDSLLESVNPFVIEGQLFDGERSYSIRYVDGSHWVTEFDASDISGAVQVVEKRYVALRVKGHSRLCFKQLWQPVADAACEGMPVLEPQALVFVGFNDGGQ